jgi:hypothetical protein
VLAAQRRLRQQSQHYKLKIRDGAGELIGEMSSVHAADLFGGTRSIPIAS